jgi:ribosomal subunit interface protein
MPFNLTLRHGITIDGPTREMLETKVENLPRFSKHIVSTHVILEKDGSGLLLELKVSARSKVFTAKSRGFDSLIAIEDAVDKMERQLSRYEARYKEKKGSNPARREDVKGKKEDTV